MNTKDDSNQGRGILNCGSAPQWVRFTYECPMSWALMEQTTSDTRKRFCSGCMRDVFWCSNVEEAALRAEQGECIAVPASIVEHLQADPRNAGVTIAGTPRTKKEMLADAFREVLVEQES